MSNQYLLDTNACIVYLNKSFSNVRQRLVLEPLENVFVCSIVKAELFYGAMKSKNLTESYRKQQTFLEQFISFPFDDTAGVIFGRLKAQLELLGTPIGIADLQIASIALANYLILVTHNLREFKRVEGLNIENWEIKEG